MVGRGQGAAAGRERGTPAMQHSGQGTFKMAGGRHQRQSFSRLPHLPTRCQGQECVRHGHELGSKVMSKERVYHQQHKNKGSVSNPPYLSQHKPKCKPTSAGHAACYFFASSQF